MHSHEATVFDLGQPAYVPALAFSPDGSTVALARQTREGFGVSLRSVGDKEPNRGADLSFLPSTLSYSVNGRQLILLGDDPGEDPGMTEPGPLTVAVLAAETLAPLGEATLDVRHGTWCLEGCGSSHDQILFATWTPAIVRLPGTDRLVILHADSERLTSIDAVSHRIEAHDIVASRTWLDELMALGALAAEAKGGSQGVYRQAVAPADGTRLSVIGREGQAWRDADGAWQMSDSPLGLQPIDPDSGHRLASLESNARHVALSTDGAWILLRVWDGDSVRTDVMSTGAFTTG